MEVEYFVLAPDGKEYGPATVDTLRQWAADQRLSPTTRLRDSLASNIVVASSVPGIFDAPPVHAALQSPPVFTAPPARPVVKDSVGPLLGVLARCAAGILFFFVLHGIGVIFAGYALFYAIQLQQNGSKYGIAAILIAGVTVAALAIGWIMRLNGAGV